MTGSITPLIMLAIFLTGTLWLGMRYKKGSRNIVEYTIGNKMFTTSALIATVLATGWGGNGLISTVETIHTSGLWYIMFMVVGTMITDISCILVSNRVGIFMENYVSEKSHISIADTMRKVYGKMPGIITALATVGLVIVSIAGEILIASRILKTCINDTSSTILIVVSAAIVVLYSVLGGIRSVTVTDIFQCATFTIMIPYITYKIFRHTGMTVPQIFKTVSQSEKFQLAPILKNKTQMLSLIAGLLTSIGVYPESVQRMYMARNNQQARDTYFTSTILDLIVLLVITFLGIVTYAGYGSMTDPSMIWPTIIGDLSATFKGLFLISLFAMVMSTSDSCLNIGSSMLAHDIVNPLRKNKLTDKQQLYLAKVACFSIGIFSIFLALSASKYKDALFRLLFLAVDIGNPIFVAPFLLAVWGFRCKEKVAVLGMAVGVITITLWKKFIPDIDGSFVAMLANGITMLLAHYSLPGKDHQGGAKPSLNYP